MGPGDANDGLAETAAPLSGAAASRSPGSVPSWLGVTWVRVSILVGVALVSFAAAIAIAYELAQARVPQHRATLERLIRAHTGLDVRFNELGFRWGWHGPEAVFRRVELGEPGRSNVLLRAPQLIVGINAWRTLQSGQLSAGRITLIAPDIDLERLSRPATSPSEPGGAAASGQASATGRLRMLERWRGGVIDLQGGTLRLPDPGGSDNVLTLPIRRAALRRSGNDWSGHALVFLPERLGRTARVVAQLTGDIAKPESLSGALRFEGVRLSFAAWRGMLEEAPLIARNLPAAGSGDVALNVTFQKGQVEKADGQVSGAGIRLEPPTWIHSAAADSAARSAVTLDYVSGDWRFVRRAAGAQLQLERLALSREDKESPLPRVFIELGAGHVRSQVARAPLRSIAAVARWLAPALAPDGVVLSGTAEDIDFDWNAARPAGHRLAASARVRDASVQPTSGSFVLKSLPVRLSATESSVQIELDAQEASLVLASQSDLPFEALKLASILEVTPTATGWQLATDELSVDHEAGRAVLSGTLVSNIAGGVPTLDARATIAHADIGKLQELFAGSIVSAFGPSAARLTAGRIEDATFDVKGAVDTLFASASPGQEAATASMPQRPVVERSFNGSLTLADGRVAAEGLWPEATGLEARIEWTGPRIRAAISAGRAGDFDLESAEARWDASGQRASHVTGRARARIEQALQWLRANPELREYAPHVHDLVASGDALFDFDVTMPASASISPPESPQPPGARVVAMLEGVTFQLAPELPPVESMRGSLAFDGGRLQRSMLSATWLGGPLALRLSERRDRRGAALAVEVQGFVDAGKLVALSQIRQLPEVTGETPWSGEFLYTAPSGSEPGRWQGRADSNLIGVSSVLPAPLAKNAAASLPLHIEMTGSGDTSELRASLAERVRTAFALKVRDGDDWQIERGAVRVGGGAATLPEDGVISIQGRVKRLDLPEYVLAWLQLRKGSGATPAEIDLATDELVIGDRAFADATVTARPADRGTSLRVQAGSLGTLTGTLEQSSREVVFNDLALEKGALAGDGTVRCGITLEKCHVEFQLATGDAAAVLADLGFRPELSARRGSLSGDMNWEPRTERSWLETLTGSLRMRFEDGTARSAQDAKGRPFALLTIPAILGGVARPPGAEGVPPGELRFRRLDAQFQVRDGEAVTSDLHFDGDAEIIVRGRTGLLAQDYDHEAWVLRGEERIPAAVRRLAATPRVAAAWLTLRDLIRGDGGNPSRIVLHLRGSWDEPVVSVDQ